MLVRQNGNCFFKLGLVVGTITCILRNTIFITQVDSSEEPFPPQNQFWCRCFIRLRNMKRNRNKECIVFVKYVTLHSPCCLVVASNITWHKQKHNLNPYNSSPHTEKKHIKESRGITHIVFASAPVLNPLNHLCLPSCLPALWNHVTKQLPPHYFWQLLRATHMSRYRSPVVLANERKPFFEHH